MDVLIAANPDGYPEGDGRDQEAERMKQQMLQDMQQRGQSSSMDLPASIFEESGAAGVSTWACWWPRS